MADDILKEAQEAYRECQERERENRQNAEEDIRFARLEEQWPEDVKRQRELDGRPCLTINKLGPIIRQVVNDARQNKPQIKVQPQDSKADPETAEVMSGLIRNIETSSDADTAYDTAVGDAVSGGFGYFRINLKYACDDNWDQDIVIERVANPFAVFGDPYSTAADSSDWNVAFVTDQISKKQYQKEYKGADEVDWDAGEWPLSWREGDQITIAEYWKREKVKRQIVLLSDASTLDLKAFEARAEEYYMAGIQVMGAPREVMGYQVTQRVLSGVEEIAKTDWAGKYIPIVPVYGDEINLKGKRYFRSLIRSAVDAQRMFNYWSTQSTELVALAPKAPYIGRKGAFEHDAEKWATANTKSHAYIEYDGADKPERQPFAGVPAGALQEALSASDHIKAVTGIYDASLGARSNETSGRAIMVRQREGDVATFHFIDNLSRAIRHGGRILIDLIPKVYTEERVIRVLGAEGQVDTIPLGQPVQMKDKRGQPQIENGQPVTKIYDLSVGKYDLTVSAGPSFTTRREEAANQMVEFIRAFPAAAPVLGDLLAKNLDWPGADEIEQRLKALLPPQLQEGGGQNPEQAQAMQMAQEQMQQLVGEFEKLKTSYETLQNDKTLEVEKLGMEARKISVDEYKAQTERMTAVANATKPTQVRDAA